MLHVEDDEVSSRGRGEPRDAGGGKLEHHRAELARRTPSRSFFLMGLAFMTSFVRSNAPQFFLEQGIVFDFTVHDMAGMRPWARSQMLWQALTPLP